MSYQSDIYTRLTTDATLSGLVGSRVFADVGDSSTGTPYIVYQVISTDGETAHDGTRDIEFPLVQFSVWGASKTSVIQTASALNATLDGQTIPGDSDLTMVFTDQSGTYENASNLFGEILQFRGHCNRN